MRDRMLEDRARSQETASEISKSQADSQTESESSGESDPSLDEDQDDLVEITLVGTENRVLVVAPKIETPEGPVAVQALVDTGAMVSVMGKALWDSISTKLNLQLEPPTYKKIKGLGNSVVEVLGQVWLPLQLSAQYSTGPVPFLVISSNAMNYDLICGVDMLRQESLLPDLKNKELLVRSGDAVKAVIRIKDDEVSSIRHCFPKEATKIPPKVGIMVPIELPDVDFQSPSVFLFEGIKSSKVQAVSGLMATDEKTPMVCVMNISDHELGLAVGDKLGTLVRLQVKEPLDLAMNRKELVEVGTVEFPNNPALESEPEWTSDTLVEAFGINQLSLAEGQKQALIKTLFNRREAISLGDGDVGHTTIISHEVETETDRPVRVPVRRLPGPMVDEIEKCCLEMEEQGVIRKSYSPYSAPVVPIRKKDGTIRLCIDYRALNKVTKTDSFPLPNLIDMLFSLNGCKFFTSIDLVKGYYQVSMNEDSIEKTAFSTPLSHWEFLRMPFGLKNAPATFQRGMAMAMANIPWTKALVYLDDILVLGRTFDEHLENLDLVLSALERSGFKLKASKTVVCREKVQFLGHIISQEGMKPLEKNLEGLLNFPVPTTVRQVRQFLGMVNFYRRHIPDCSQISKPLSELTGRKSLKWTQDCQKAFETLKAALTSPPLLVYPDWTQNANPLRLHVDASDVGAGACLSQEHSGEVRPIAYVSTTFNPAERRYSTTAKELAGLRWAVRALRPFLCGIKVLIYTDHKPLIYLQNMAVVDDRVARTLEELSQIDYELHYVPGKENIIADALSRSPLLQEGEEGTGVYPKGDTIPPGFFKTEMPGGGDSLFQCFSQWLYGTADQHVVLRQQLVDDLLTHQKEYRLPPRVNKLLKLMKHAGQLPVSQCIEAFCRREQVRVIVHFGDTMTLHYGDGIRTERTCHLQCLANVHYNLLVPTVGNRVDLDVEPRAPEELNDHVSESGSLNPDINLFTEHCLLDESRDAPSLSGEEELSSSHSCSLSEEPAQGTPQHLLVEVGMISAAAVGDTLIEGNALSYEWVAYLQEIDSDLLRLKEILERGDPSEMMVGELAPFRRRRASLVLEDNSLFFQDQAGMLRYVVSGFTLISVALQFHLDYAHIGRNKLIKMLNDHLWHPSIKKVAADITRACIDCQRAKATNTLAAPPVFKISTSCPFELVAADLISLPLASGGHRYALVVVDHFSKWVIIRPLRNKTSESVATTLREQIMPYLIRIPDRLLTDNGREFTGAPFVESLRDYGVKHVLTSPYSPSSNGAVERVNRTFTQLLRLLSVEGASWVDQLPRVLHIYNNTVHSETNMSPVECLLKIAHPIKPGPKGAHPETPFWEESGQGFRAFRVGEAVALRVHHMGDSTANKLLDRYTGPYCVLKVNPNGVTYQIQGSGRILKSHHKHLRKWFTPPDYLMQHRLYKLWYDAKMKQTDIPREPTETHDEEILPPRLLFPDEEITPPKESSEEGIPSGQGRINPLRMVSLSAAEYQTFCQQLLSFFLTVENSLRTMVAGTPPCSPHSLLNSGLDPESSSFSGFPVGETLDEFSFLGFPAAGGEDEVGERSDRCEPEDQGSDTHVSLSDLLEETLNSSLQFLLELEESLQSSPEEKSYTSYLEVTLRTPQPTSTPRVARRLSQQFKNAVGAQLSPVLEGEEECSREVPASE